MTISRIIIAPGMDFSHTTTRSGSQSKCCHQSQPATFNIRLLTDIMSISPGPSPTYLYTVVSAMLEMLLNLQNAGES